MIFSKRRQLEAEVKQWFRDKEGVPLNVFNIITAVNSLGYLRDEKIMDSFQSVPGTKRQPGTG